MQTHTVNSKKQTVLLRLLVFVGLCVFGLSVWTTRQQGPETHQLSMLFEIDGPYLDEQIYQKQLILLQELSSAEVIAFNALQQTTAEQWIAPDEQFDEAVKQLSQSVTAELVPNTNLLKVSMTTNRQLNLNDVALAYGNALVEHLLHINQTLYIENIKPLHDALISQEEAINEALLREKQWKKDQQIFEQVRRLRHEKATLDAKLQQLLIKESTSEIHKPQTQANTYSHRVLLNRALDKQAEQQKALSSVSEDHPLYAKLRNALKQTELEITGIEQQMNALQALVTHNGNQAAQHAKASRINLVRQQIAKLDHDLKQLPSGLPPKETEQVTSDQLFKELETLENKLIEQKKNNLQLTLSWFRKPAP